jgi:hypothetical protein
MNLFTSSSKTEAKVIAAVLLALLACELALRKFEPALSRDLKHIRAIPKLAENLAGSKNFRILFLGNSFTRVSIDPKVFLSEMRSHGFNHIEVERVFPDGTQLNEWYHAFKTYFAEPNRSPDLLVIVTGRAHLQDQPIDPRTFGAYFSSGSDVAAFLTDPSPSLDEKVEFLLAHYFAISANRHRVEPRVFSFLIPHYQTCVQQINEERLRPAPGPRRRNPITYSHLEKLLELGGKESVPIVIMTTPMSQHYSMDPKIPQLIAAHGMTFLEANEINGIDSSHFPDGYHIDASGAEKYTRKIAGEFARIFETDPVFQKAR